jgi:hypothetical protein
MAMRAYISIRKINNGFLVSPRADDLLYGGSPDAETFYPSLEAMIGDASAIFTHAMEQSERAAAAGDLASQQKLEWTTQQEANVGKGSEE